MAEAVVEERQLLKSLRWWDGFTIGLCQPGFLLGSLLAAYGSLGVLGATVLWGIAAVVALLSVWIYSEPAMMFPGRSGGISLYANEGWRRYTTLVGPVATFGYWIGWSVVLAIFGNLIGSLSSGAVVLQHELGRVRRRRPPEPLQLHRDRRASCSCGWPTSSGCGRSSGLRT